MKTHPILFQSEMIRAIFSKQKKETRRTKGLEKMNESPDDWEVYTDVFYHFHNKKTNEEKMIVCPYGIKGDILWVRETWNINPFYGELSDPVEFLIDLDEFLYKASDEPFEGQKWKPSIFMPKTACRIFLKVISIKPERLQNIDEDGARREGIEKLVTGYYRNYLNKNLHCPPYSSFKSLWIKINKQASWNKNPWVWRIQFEETIKPENFLL